jgi:hypothetical protein
MAGDNDEVKANGGGEPPISFAEAQVEAGPSAPAHLEPPTKADSPL